MSELIDGLGPNRKLMVVGADVRPIEVTPIQLIFGTRMIEGWARGSPADTEDTTKRGAPDDRTYPLEKAAEGYARMMSGRAQFRVVLTM